MLQGGRCLPWCQGGLRLVLLHASLFAAPRPVLFPPPPVPPGASRCWNGGWTRRAARGLSPPACASCPKCSSSFSSKVGRSCGRLGSRWHCTAGPPPCLHRLPARQPSRAWLALVPSRLPPSALAPCAARSRPRRRRCAPAAAVGARGHPVGAVHPVQPGGAPGLQGPIHAPHVAAGGQGGCTGCSRRRTWAC